MKWKNHIAITRAVSKSLNLKREWEGALVEGSIKPDKKANSYEKHHHARLKKVMGHIWNARKDFIKGNHLKAMTNLGIALHFVQDKCVYKGFFASHDRLESKLTSQNVSYNSIEVGITEAQSSPRYIKKIINNIRPGIKVDAIMAQACENSSAIVKAVVDKEQPSKELLEKFRNAQQRHEKITIPISGLVFLAILIIPPLLNPSSSLLIWLLCAIVGTYLVNKLDINYHTLKEEAKWFGIDTD